MTMRFDLHYQGRIMSSYTHLPLPDYRPVQRKRTGFLLLIALILFFAGLVAGVVWLLTWYATIPLWLGIAGTALAVLLLLYVAYFRSWHEPGEPSPRTTSTT